MECSLAMLALGGLGGAANALLCRDLGLWPRMIAAGPQGRLTRPGLLVNAAAGAAAALGACLAFRPDGASAEPASGVGPRLAVAGIAVGMLAARWISAEADKRLLRAAVSKACLAPAAHPDTVQGIEVAPPHEVYATADRLNPRHSQ